MEVPLIPTYSPPDFIIWRIEWTSSSAVSASVYMCIHTYHVRNNYVTYIVAMRPYFSRLRQFRRLLCVASCYE